MTLLVREVIKEKGVPQRLFVRDKGGEETSFGSPDWGEGKKSEVVRKKKHVYSQRKEEPDCRKNT